jgi:arginase family enzyme
LQNREAPDAYERIEATLAQIIKSKKRSMSLGSNHSVTYPILWAVGKRFPESGWYTFGINGNRSRQNTERALGKMIAG